MVLLELVGFIIAVVVASDLVDFFGLSSVKSIIAIFFDGLEAEEEDEEERLRYGFFGGGGGGCLVEVLREEVVDCDFGGGGGGGFR